MLLGCFQVPVNQLAGAADVLDGEPLYAGGPTGTLNVSNINTALGNGQADVTAAVVLNDVVAGDITGTLAVGATAAQIWEYATRTISEVSGAVGSVTGGIGGTLANLSAGAISAIQSGLATIANQNTIIAGISLSLAGIAQLEAGVLLTPGTGSGEILLDNGTVTASGSGGETVTVDSLTTGALAQIAGVVDITVLPVQAASVTPATPNGPISVFQNSAQTIIWPPCVDGTGNPIDLNGKTLRFVAFNCDNPDTPVLQIDSGFTVGGTDNNVPSLALTTAQTAVPLALTCTLWDLTDNLVLANGPFEIAAVTRGNNISGSGNTTITVNTGEVDNLRAVDGNGNGVAGISLSLYLASAWTANGATAPVLATSETGADGRMLNNMLAASGTTYAVVFRGQPGTIESVVNISI